MHGLHEVPGWVLPVATSVLAALNLVVPWPGHKARQALVRTRRFPRQVLLVGVAPGFDRRARHPRVQRALTVARWVLAAALVAAIVIWVISLPQ